MIVSADEINLIQNPKFRRRAMRLPVLSGRFGERKRCPVRRGGTYRLRIPGAKEAQTTITVISVHLERLAALSLADARREGYGSVRGALDAWAKTHWTPGDDEMVWVVAFARDPRGDVAETINRDQPVYLADRGGDYTLDSHRAAKGEPEVLMPFEEELRRARAKAVEKRHGPQLEGLGRMRERAETLRESMTNMKARELVRRALHHEAKASESESVDAMVRQAEAAGGKDSVVVYKRNRRQVRAVVPFELYLELLAIADGQSDFEATVEMAQDFGTKYHEAREALEKIERGNEYVDNAFRLSRHNQNQIVRSVLAIADAAA